jgi:hypothetical protein
MRGGPIADGMCVASLPPDPRATAWPRSRPPLRAVVLAVWATWWASGWAVACPVCETETGRQVRQGIFDATFPRYLLISALPFAVVSLAVVLIPRLLPLGRKAREK